MTAIDIEQTMSVRLAAAYLGTTEANIRRKQADGVLRTVAQTGLRKYARNGKVRQTRQWPDVYLADLEAETATRPAGRPSKPDYLTLTGEQAHHAIEQLTDLGAVDDFNVEGWADWLLTLGGPSEYRLCGYGDDCESCKAAEAEAKRTKASGGRTRVFYSGDIEAVASRMERRDLGRSGRKTNVSDEHGDRYGQPSMGRQQNSPRLPMAPTGTGPEKLTPKMARTVSREMREARAIYLDQEDRMFQPRWKVNFA